MSIFDINLGADISRPETYGGSGKNIYGHKYGKAAESEEKDHEILWSTFVGKPEGNDYKNFLNASLSEKAQILKNRASDTDDVLFRTKEWMRISGNPKAEEDYIPSVLEYANPFTRSLPNGNTMMPDDFR